MRTFLIILLAATSVVSCQKNNSPDAATAKVDIIINNPQEGQTFRRGDTVYINATVNYAGQLHGCEAKITDSVTGFTLYDDAQHTHQSNFIVADKWPNELDTPMKLKVSVIAYVDHNGNYFKQDRNIYIAQ